MDFHKIGKLEEGDFDAMVEAAGGHRLSVDHSREVRPNADYVLGEAVVELKLVEEDGLEKQDRQRKVAEIFRAQQPDRPVIILRPALLDEDGQRAYYSAMVGPIKAHVKKAAKQLEETANWLGGRPTRVLLLINNGYASLSHDEFKEIAVKRACNDTRSIDGLLIGGYYYYSDTMEHYFFPRLDLVPINADRPFRSFDVLRQQWSRFANQFMTAFVRGEEERSRKRPPVEELKYDLDGVTYIKPAPPMGKPSKFWPNGRPRRNSTDISELPPVAHTFPKLDQDNWQRFRERFPTADFFKASYPEWLRFKEDQEKELGSPTMPFVPVEVTFDGFAEWYQGERQETSASAICQHANALFEERVRKLMVTARERGKSGIVLPEYIYLMAEQIGQDKANDLVSIFHVWERPEGSREKELLGNGRLFFEYALALAGAYAIKRGVGIVLYDKDQTNAWV